MGRQDCTLPNHQLYGDGTGPPMLNVAIPIQPQDINALFEQQKGKQQQLLPQAQSH